MINPLNFLHFQDHRIDWKHHDSGAAQERLANSAQVAIHRRLQEGAENFLPSEHLVNAINAAIASRHQRRHRLALAAAADW